MLCVFVGLEYQTACSSKGGGIGVMERYIRTDLKSVEKGTREKLV